MIVEKHTNLKYRVQKVGEKKTMVIHIDRLRHYGSQRLSFETDTLSVEPDQSEVVVIKDQDAVNHDANESGASSKELEA